VDEPLTEDLLENLMNAPDTRFVAEETYTVNRNLATYLQELLNERNLKRSAVVKAAGINDTFGYQIFTGARKASRDNLLKLAFAIGLSVRETNRLLQAGGVNTLYCKNRRDALIIFALSHHFSLQQLDEELYRFGEATLG
jgi:hypothetical protein